MKIALVSLALLAGCTAENHRNVEMADSEQKGTDSRETGVRKIGIPSRAVDAGCSSKAVVSFDEWANHSESVFVGEIAKIGIVDDIVFQAHDPSAQTPIDDCTISDAYPLRPGVRVTLSNVRLLGGEPVPEEVEVYIGSESTANWVPMPYTDSTYKLLWHGVGQTLGVGMTLGGTFFRNEDWGVWTPQTTALFEVEPTTDRLIFQEPVCGDLPSQMPDDLASLAALLSANTWAPYSVLENTPPDEYARKNLASTCYDGTFSDDDDQNDDPENPGDLVDPG